jgi:hypothetical protein
MTALITGFINRKTVQYVTAAFLIFSTGFLIYYGKGVANSKSWKYIITTSDEYSYWTFAKGASETPASDGNPFFIEERGRRHPFLYPTSNIIGWLAKIMHVFPLFFFPIWHIGMPFVFWLTLFLCLKHFWKLSESESAVFSFFLLLSSLFIRGQVSDILIRFARPGDMLWLLIIWLSFIMNPEAVTKRSHLIIILTLIFISIWLNPMLSLLGILVTFCELSWQIAVKKENLGKQIPRLLALVVSVITFLAWYVTLKIYIARHPWLHYAFTEGIDVGLKNQELHSLIFYGLICILVLAKTILTRQALNLADRLLLFVLLIDPAFTFAHVFLPSDYQFSTHRYCFWTIESACLMGWFLGIFNDLKENAVFKKFQIPLFSILLALQIWLITIPEYNFLNFGAVSRATHDFADSSFTLLSMMPTVIVLAWLTIKLKGRRNQILNRTIVCSSIIFLTIAGYMRLNPGFDGNYNFPFDGAYQWFNKNSKKDEVVLTLPPGRLHKDYLILYTNQKAYLNPYGDQLAAGKRNETNLKKFFFYLNLLTGDVNSYQVNQPLSLEEKINYPKLDYILLELASPFYQSTWDQLKGYLTEVYRDEKCLLWKVERTRAVPI